MRPGGDPALVQEEGEEPMSDELILGRHSQCQPSPISTLGEASRAAASFKQALQRTRRGRRGCSRCVPCAGSLSLGR